MLKKHREEMIFVHVEAVRSINIAMGRRCRKNILKKPSHLGGGFFVVKREVNFRTFRVVRQPYKGSRFINVFFLHDTL